LYKLSIKNVIDDQTNDISDVGDMQYSTELVKIPEMHRVYSGV